MKFYDGINIYKLTNQLKKKSKEKELSPLDIR